jgi:predicted nucleic acid-binding protein
LRIDHKRSVRSALDLFGQTNLDFEDCLTIEHARRNGCSAIVSYDRDFDAVAGVIRREP